MARVYTHVRPGWETALTTSDHCAFYGWRTAQDYRGPLETPLVDDDELNMPANPQFRHPKEQASWAGLDSADRFASSMHQTLSPVDVGPDDPFAALPQLPERTDLRPSVGPAGILPHTRPSGRVPSGTIAAAATPSSPRVWFDTSSVRMPWSHKQRCILCVLKVSRPHQVGFHCLRCRLSVREMSAH